MKKFLILMSLAIVAMASIAQTRVTEVSTNGAIKEPAYVYLWGTSADTLTNGDTLTYVLRVKGDWTQDFNCQLYNDFVSGTAGGKLKSYKSIDGVNYVVTAAADSITVTSLTADALDSEVLTFSDFNYPYLKFIYIQSGTAVTVPKLYVYTKKN